MQSQEVDFMDVDEISDNKGLADYLYEIAGYYMILQDEYRTKAFTNAADGVAKCEIPIVSGKHAKSVIPRGIGASNMEEIDIFLSGRTSTRFSELESKCTAQKKILDYFRGFYGVGPVTALRFYNAGFRTREDLEFKAKLNDKQKLGLKWHDDIVQRIPRDEIGKIRDHLAPILDSLNTRWEIAGSYRRGEETSGDVDVIVEGNSNKISLADIVESLGDLLPDHLALGNTKYMGIFRLPSCHGETQVGRRIDIRLVDSTSYPFALLYFTGSQKFNILCRQRAIELGYRLNEYGLYKNSQPNSRSKSAKQTQDNTVISLHAVSEADIFRLLQIEYIEPTQRNRDMDTLTATFVQTPVKLLVRKPIK